MKPRKSIRIKGYDYKTNGYYFVTICTALRRPLLEQYKKEAEQILQGLPSRFIGVKVDFYNLMPNHLHAILILENSSRINPTATGINCSGSDINIGTNDVGVTLGEIIRTYKALVTKTTGQKPFWEWNYYEHVIRSEEELKKIRLYITANPYREKIDWKNVEMYLLAQE